MKRNLAIKSVIPTVIFLAFIACNLSAEDSKCATDDIVCLLGGAQANTSTKAGPSISEVSNASRKSLNAQGKEIQKIGNAIKESLSTVSEPITGCSSTLQVTLRMGSWYSKGLQVSATQMPSGVSQYSKGSFLDSDRSVSMGFQSYGEQCIGGTFGFSVALVDVGMVYPDEGKNFTRTYSVPDGAKSCSLSITTSGHLSGTCS